MEAMILFLLILSIGLNVAVLGFVLAISKLLVKMQESDQGRIRRFLQSRGLIDIPMVYEGQNDYTDAAMQDRRSGDLRYVKDT